MDTGLEALLEEVRACRLCEAHLPLGPRPVLRASASARILIAGQAPGTRVHQTGIPWNDLSGQRLRDWLGIDRETFYDESRIAILPMGFCYPGKGSRGDLPPRPECAPLWRSRLLAQMPQIRLTLAIGQYAIAYHLGARKAPSLTETVRRWAQYRDLGVIPLPHPSPRNVGWRQANAWFEAETALRIREAVWEALDG
ncbi:MAG: uracil-DNA glycosylase family protein [Bacteroidia bacterium]|nr:uracil-DNA glycosylase family protein [Bacteroidia bacterium]